MRKLCGVERFIINFVDTALVVFISCFYMLKKIHIREMTIKEFRAKFVTNTHRAGLFKCFQVELKKLREQCKEYRMIVFGSFLTKKKKPGDIDLIISLIPDKNCVYSIMTQGLDREYCEEIDIMYHKAEYFLMSAEQLITYFNENPRNFNKFIALTEAVELVDA